MWAYQDLSAAADWDLRIMKSDALTSAAADELWARHIVNAPGNTYCRGAKIK